MMSKERIMDIIKNERVYSYLSEIRDIATAEGLSMEDMEEIDKAIDAQHKKIISSNLDS